MGKTSKKAPVDHSKRSIENSLSHRGGRGGDSLAEFEDKRESTVRQRRCRQQMTDSLQMKQVLKGMPPSRRCPPIWAEAGQSALALPSDGFSSFGGDTFSNWHLPIQKKPVKTDKDDPRHYHDDVKTALKLEKEEGFKENEYHLRDMFKIVYWKDPDYFMDDAFLQKFDLDKFLETKEFGAWMESYKEVSKRVSGLGLHQKELKDALSMHLLQKFMVNAVFNAEEITRQEYQASPLSYQDENGYLRSFASSFVKALKDKLPGNYSANQLFLARNTNFREVLPQYFNVIDFQVAPKVDSVKVALASTIDRIADFTVKNAGLDKYLDVPGNFIDFVDFSDLLSTLKIPKQVQDNNKNYGELVYKTVYDEAVPKIVDAYVEKHYALVKDKTELKKQIKAQLKDKSGDFSAFESVLKGADKDAFAEHKKKGINDADQVLKSQKTVNKDDSQQLLAYIAQMAPFDQWFRDNHANKSGKVSGNGAYKSSDEKDRLNKFLKAKEEDEKKAHFLELTKKQGGAFSTYLTGKKEKAEKLTEKGYLDNEFSCLETLLSSTKEGLPTVIVTGGVITVDDTIGGYKQPALLVSDNTMAPAIKTALNKSGYVPSPTYANRKMLEKGVSLKEIVTQVGTLQKDTKAKSKETRNKLTEILSEIAGFDPAAYTSVVDVANQFKKTETSFKAFEALSNSTIDYVNILAPVVSKLISGLAILDKGSTYPALAMAEMKANLDAAVSNQKDMVKFVRNIQNLHEQIILALELNGKTPEKDYAYNIPTDKDHFQGANITDYGLKAFSVAYRAAKAQHGDKAFHIDAYYNIYFELTQKLMYTQGASSGKVSVRTPKTLDDFKARFNTVKMPNPNLVIVDVHPNDASRVEMHMQEVEKLITWVYANEPKDYRCTFIVDITLNHITEDKIGRIKRRADKYIKSGNCNLVFIQSLTKFAQTGMDKHSGGLMFHYNDPKKWGTFNDEVDKSIKADPADETTQKYFQAMFEYTETEQVRYLQKVRKNTKYVYDQLKDRFSKLDIKESAIQIAESDDPGTCYVAFHYKEFAAKVFKNEISGDAIHKMNVDVMDNTLGKLMQQIGLPMSMRQSFGFPISNLGDTGEQIRLTVGIEAQDLLDKYIKVVTFVNAKLAKKLAEGKGAETLKDAKKRKVFLEEITLGIDTMEKLDLQLNPLFKI